MSETKTYHVFQFIKNGDNSWECKRTSRYGYVPEYVNWRLVTPIQSFMRYSTGFVLDTCCVKMTRFKTIVTVMVEEDDIARAEVEWKDALEEFYKKRKRAAAQAEKSRIRAFDIASSTVDYTRP